MIQEKLRKVNEITIEVTEPIISALKKMDDSGLKLLIVNNQGNFFSLLSIGDIQRALLKGKGLETKVTEILRSKLVVCKKDESIDEVKAKMLHYRAEFMPILNESNEMTDVIFWEEIMLENKNDGIDNLDLPVIIMAGGVGTRLRPLTHIIPKPLIPFGNKTILEVIIDKFCKVGCSEFYFSVNYKAEMIKNYFDHLEKSYSIDYFTEDQPLGTAGSLSLLKGKIDTTFFVSNCDVIIDEDYREIYKYHKENQNELTIVASLKHYPIPYGTIEMEAGGVLKTLKEKPDLFFWINTGMYILEPHLLDKIPDNTFFHITELIEQLKNDNKRVGVFPVSEKSWIDIGEWKEYYKILERDITS